MELFCNYRIYIILSNLFCILNKRINELLYELYKIKLDKNKVIQFKIYIVYVQILYLFFGSVNVCFLLQFLFLIIQFNGYILQQYFGGLIGFLYFRGGQFIDIYVTLLFCKLYNKLGICSYFFYFDNILNSNYIMELQVKFSF